MMAARYDPDMEEEVAGWFQALLSEDIGSGQREVERALRSGVLLVKLAKEIQKGTENCPMPAKRLKLKPITKFGPGGDTEEDIQAAAFKQIDNLEAFVKFCKGYGVKENFLFNPTEFYEGRNTGLALTCLAQLGTVAQKNGFGGATIGTKPQEDNFRTFTQEQLRAGQGMVNVQCGTNQYASQRGMRGMGAIRLGADIRSDDASKESSSIINRQLGTNEFCSQKGYVLGARRHGADYRQDKDMTPDAQGILSAQTGYNLGASQKGMRQIGGLRIGADMRMDAEMQQCEIISPQMGSFKGANQSGMRIGSVRHGGDLKCEQMVDVTTMPMHQCYPEGANQSGMSLGSIRHGADLKAEDADDAGKAYISPQMGSFQGANQSGMSCGVRHAGDLKPGAEISQGGHSVIGGQMGSYKGASQKGMGFGVRHGADLKIEGTKNWNERSLAQ